MDRKVICYLGMERSNKSIFASLAAVIAPLSEDKTTTSFPTDEM